MTADSWDAERYARHARFVADLGEPLLDVLAPQPGEAILDLGCGDGALTQKLMATGAQVLAIDASPSMIEAARQRGIKAEVIDGHEIPFVGQFDAVFSNAALHWMTRPADVVRGVHRSLRPGGRFVGEFGGAGNVERILEAVRAVFAQRFPDRQLVEPWYFPTAEAYGDVLGAYGFEVSSIALFARPTPLPTGLVGWMQTFGRGFLAEMSEEEANSFLAAVETEAAPTLRGPDGAWTADYVRLRFVAFRR